MIRRASLVMLSTALGACAETGPPRGQILLYVDTDASLPPASAHVRADGDPHPLFDSLRIEVFQPGQTTPCAGCTRTTTVDAGMFEERRASIGIVMAPRAPGYRVRARLFSSRATTTSEPPAPYADGSAPASVIEVVAELPAIGQDGIVERSILLSTDSVGLPSGSLASPVATMPGRPFRSLVGTWSGARRIPCAGDPLEGEVCIPGGAFWMGNAKVPGEFQIDGADRLRLVVLSPFFLDRTEVTVGRFRAAGFKPELPWSGGSTGNFPLDLCDFTAAPGANEDLPVNCMSWTRARAFCQSRGGDLPTEAQYEYVAGALRSRLYVWGEDPPALAPAGCADAVLARGGWGVVSNYASECMPNVAPGGPLAVGSAIPTPRRDRLVLAGGAILYDLVGNLSERTLDRWSRQDEPCWSGGGVFFDPVCAEGTGHTLRGGSWIDNAQLAMAAARRPASDAAGPGFVVPFDSGLRCARPGAP